VAQTSVSQLNIRYSASGLLLLLLDDIHSPDNLSYTTSNIPPDANLDMYKQHPIANLTALKPLHRHLISLSLHNPYWNDFRILNHFHRRNIPITMDDLHFLKEQCGLDNRETICNTLIRLSVNGGLKLNDRQISFIEKNKPEYRDRDLQSFQPGELLIYECLFGRGIGNLGRIYVHLFVDVFTGYTFGELSPRRSLAVGLEVLMNTVMPLYYTNNYPINTILHSAKNMSELKESNQLEADETFSRLGLQWQPIQRKFGSIEKFEKSLLANQFFDTAIECGDSFSTIKPLFDQCLVKYNSSIRSFSRRNLLQE
jgi:hypothetical protein